MTSLLLVGQAVPLSWRSASQAGVGGFTWSFHKLEAVLLLIPAFPVFLETSLLPANHSSLRSHGRGTILYVKLSL